MHIAILAPVGTSDIASLLPDAPNLPVGYTGAPLIGTLIRELLARGHRVSAITHCPEVSKSNPVVRMQSGAFEVVYCRRRPRAFRYTRGELGRAVDFFKYERRLMESVLRELRPDIVNAHWAYEFGMAALASDFPVVVTCHDSPGKVLRYVPDAYRLVRYFMGRRCLAQSRYTTAVSPYLAEAVSKYCGTPVAVTQNPLPASSHDAPPITEQTKPPDQDSLRVIMVINGWSKRKNPRPAFRAFQLLRARMGKAPSLHVFGHDFGPGQIADRWCGRHELVEGVVFHGPVDHQRILDALSHAQLMIHPALEESCPMGVAEALSLGVPVVGGKESGGTAWVIGKGGLLVDVRSPEQIAEAAYKILGTPKTFADVRRDALASARRFDSGRVVELYEKQFEKALRKMEGREDDV